jgi:hypothetical protein
MTGGPVTISSFQVENRDLVLPGRLGWGTDVNETFFAGSPATGGGDLTWNASARGSAGRATATQEAEPEERRAQQRKRTRLGDGINPREEERIDQPG